METVKGGDDRTPTPTGPVGQGVCAGGGGGGISGGLLGF